MSSFIKLDFSLCHSHEVVLFVIFTYNEIVVSKEVAFSLPHKVMISLFGCTITITIVMMSWMFLQQQLIIGLLLLMSLISRFGFNVLVIIIVVIIIY